MIRITVNRKIKYPLPVRTGNPFILKRTVTERKNGRILSKKKNHKSVETVWLYPGKELIVEDSWRDLEDINSYFKKKMINIFDVQKEKEKSLPKRKTKKGDK